jgi:hypothetical protein
VELEVEKDIPRFPHHPEDLRAGGDKELETDLEDAHRSLEPLREVSGLGGVVEVEGENDPLPGLSFGMCRFPRS